MIQEEKAGGMKNEDNQSLKKDYRDILDLKKDHNVLNKDFFMYLQDISVAIKTRKKISFISAKWKFDDHKKLKLLGEEKDRIIVSPYYITSALGNMYLLCKKEEQESIIFKRIDRMKELKVLEDVETEELRKTERDQLEYMQNQAYHFGGKSKTISFRGKNEILNQVVDFFGHKANVKPDKEEGYFRLEVRSSIDSVKYWVYSILP